MPKVDWVWYHKQDISAAGTVTYFDTDQATSGINVTNMNAALQQDTIVELVIGETTIITAPLYLFRTNYANLRYEFENPITLAGGIGFKVDLHVGTAPSAGTSVTVSLVGVREY